MKYIIMATLLLLPILLITGCKHSSAPAPDYSVLPDENAIPYEYFADDGEDCASTGHHVATGESPAEAHHRLCEMLKDDSLNNNCAYFKRERKYEVECVQRRSHNRRGHDHRHDGEDERD
jgi:hypothetical protein